MNNWLIVLTALAVQAAGGNALAQNQPADVEQRRAAAEAEAKREIEREAERIERVVQREEEIVRAARDAEAVVADVELEMREAESRMAEAARRIAELSMRQLPSVSGGAWQSSSAGRPVLGVTISASDEGGPVEGVEILGVSPGGAAAEAGLRAGDIITAVNTEALSSDNSRKANSKLLDFMSALEEGDVIDVEYLRAGKSASLTLEPRAVSMEIFSFGGPGGNFHFPAAPTAPGAPGAPRMEVNRFVFMTDGQGFGDMEMVRVTEGLGRYFGTDEGLLVIRAPQDDSFQLQDGDVILDIDGRKPASVSHAIRILGSYQGGESLKLRIMRDKRERTLGIEMPQASNRPGGPFVEPLAPVVPAAPRPSRVLPVAPRSHAED